jgi:lysophospholipase L1-like esterase
LVESDHVSSDRTASAPGVVAAGVRWIGRVDTGDPARPRFSWSGTGFVARFQGTSLTAQLGNEGRFIFKAVVDGAPQPAFTSLAGAGSYALATELPAGEHTVALYRQTEGPMGLSQLHGLTVRDGALLAPPPAPQRLIEVVGDSISCGYGILGSLDNDDCYGTESHWDAYPSVMARALRAEVSTIAGSGRGVVLNYRGDALDTMPQVYERTLATEPFPTWDFRAEPQAVIINLGTNDLGNGKGDPGPRFATIYRSLVETIRARYPSAFILCTIGPLTSLSESAIVSGHIRTVLQARAAAGDTRVALFDRILPQTPDKYACAYHPNVAENAILAAQLGDELRARLDW